MLTEEEREALFDRIADWCQAWAVGHASPEECDELGMSEAQRLAARRAIDGLGLTPDQVLVDGKWDFVGGALRIVRGDSSSLSIAAASILAKVTRDRMMRESPTSHPGYIFEANKGYPVPGAQVGASGLGTNGDPSEILGVHGSSHVERAQQISPAEPQLAFEFDS